MEPDNKLKGKMVLFLDPVQGFERYGTFKSVRRATSHLKKITKDGRVIKRPTVQAAVIRDTAGRDHKVPLDLIRAVRWYGKDVPVTEWMARP